MKKHIFILTIALNIFFAKSQVTFNNNFPGYTANSILQLADGSYVFSGQKDDQFYIGRLEEKGSKILWGKQFGGDLKSVARKIIRTKDNKFVAVGNYGSTDATNYFIVKFDSLGNVIFQKQYQYTKDDYAFSIAEISNGDFWIAGHSLNSYETTRLLRINSNGDSLTTKFFTSTDYICFSDIIKTSDNNYMLAGENFGELTLQKINEAGDSLWAKTYSDPWQDARSLVQADDSGYIVASYGGSISRFDKSGTFMWTHFYPHFGFLKTLDFYTVIKTSDGNFAAVGSYIINKFNTEYQTVMVKFKANGDTIWTRSFKNEFPFNEGLGLYQTKDSGYIICGDAWNNIDTVTFNFIKTDPYGNIIILNTPSICLVTLDNTTEKNKIIWERPSTGGIEKYIICRMEGEKWMEIGTVSFDSVSQFIDITSKPGSMHYKYSLIALNSNGDSSARSPFIENILLQTNAGLKGEANLIWNPYKDESGKFIPEYYYIYRGKTKATLIKIDSISGHTASPSYSDTFIASEPYYQVGFKKACTPASILKGETGPYTQSLSNIVEYKIVGFTERNELEASIYPNPYSNSFVLTFQLEETADVIIEITDALGKKLHETRLPSLNMGSHVIELNAESLNISIGTNFIRVITKNKISILKGNHIR